MTAVPTATPRAEGALCYFAPYACRCAALSRYHGSRRFEMSPGILSPVLPRKRDARKKLLESLIARAGEPPVNRHYRDAA